MPLSLYVFLQVLNFFPSLFLFNAAYFFQGQVCPLEFSVVCISVTASRWCHSAGPFVFCVSCEMVANTEGSVKFLFNFYLATVVGRWWWCLQASFHEALHAPTDPPLCPRGLSVCPLPLTPHPSCPPCSPLLGGQPRRSQCSQGTSPSVSGGSGRPVCLRSSYFGALLESSKPKPVVSPSQT